jgi:hypothetical protein
LLVRIEVEKGKIDLFVGGLPVDLLF